MKEVTTYRNNEVSNSSGSLEPMQAQLALGALQEALNAGVIAAKNHEDAMTERALIRAKQEIEIYSIEAATQRNMANDRDVNTRRMALISIIQKLFADNAQTLTPEIFSAAQIVVSLLREER